MTIPVARWTRRNGIPARGDIRSSEESSFKSLRASTTPSTRAKQCPGWGWEWRDERGLSANESVWVGEGICDRWDGYMRLDAALSRGGKQRILVGRVRLMIQAGLRRRAVMDGESHFGPEGIAKVLGRIFITPKCRSRFDGNG